MSQPPIWAERLLSLFLHPVDRDIVLGDLEETYHHKVSTSGKTVAQRWYWLQIFRSAPPLFYRSFFWSLVMLKNYLKTALRSLNKQKGYAFINITGLAIGIASSLFILLWVQDEVKYNRYLDEGDQIHQVFRNVTEGGEIYTMRSGPKPLAETMVERYPEVTAAALMHWEEDYVVVHSEEAFREQGTFASESFFEVFSFPFLLGDPASSLLETNNMVITDRLAKKLFGENWAQRSDILGQRITVDHRQDFVVAGVIENMPAQSSIQADVIMAIHTFYAEHDWVEAWGNNGLQIFAKLDREASLAELNKKMVGIISEFDAAEEVQVVLQPFEDTYLYSRYENGVLKGGRIEYVQIFSFVAIFLLLIAVFNFTNLATARSRKRAREIGVRKAMGAHRNALVAQFLGESMLFSWLAFIAGMLLVLLLLPLFNELTDKQFSIRDLNGSFFLMAFLIANVVGLLAGSYPAFYLSSFNPLNVLRGTFLPNKGAALLRKGLVSLQFALSVLIIVATIAIYLQIRFIQDRDIGLDRENIIYLAQEGALSSQYEAVRQELLSRPGIANVSASTSNPLNIGTSTGGAKWPGKDPNDDHAFYLMGTSYNFLEAMMMELVDGRTFSQDFGADSMSFVVNEEMAKLIGDNTLGTELSFWGNNGPIIGIVKNFEMNSLYSPTAPVIIRLEAQTNSVYIRTEPGQTEEAIASLASVFATFNEGYPFDYHFLDQAFERRFKSEIVLGKLARVFAIIAIFISCLGLFGLVSYSAEQRTKELGVRKVLGASVLNLVGLLTGEVTKLVLLGVVIATPVSYFLISEWLVGFEHHIEIGPGLFFTAGFMAIGIAWLTVSYQAIKSALINPVKAIRYE